eukprot:scaffold90454_cov16-Tisochrysis_lutea.AAC.1
MVPLRRSWHHITNQQAEKLSQFNIRSLVEAGPPNRVTLHTVQTVDTPRPGGSAPGAHQQHGQHYGMAQPSSRPLFSAGIVPACRCVQASRVA